MPLPLNDKVTAPDFTFQKLRGEETLPLKQFEGKVLFVVNTASQCGFTPQYEGLEALYKQFKDQGLVIIGVPSNDFGAQEPGSNQDIASFCQIKFGVTFPLAGKEIVKGNDAHPFFLWAKQTLGIGSAPKWNFHKYLIDRKGHLIDFYLPIAPPDSAKIKTAIQKALTESA